MLPAFDSAASNREKFRYPGKDHQLKGGQKSAATERDDKKLGEEVQALAEGSNETGRGNAIRQERHWLSDGLGCTGESAARNYPTLCNSSYLARQPKRIAHGFKHRSVMLQTQDAIPSQSRKSFHDRFCGASSPR